MFGKKKRETFILPPEDAGACDGGSIATQSETHKNQDNKLSQPVRGKKQKSPKNKTAQEPIPLLQDKRKLGIILIAASIVLILAAAVSNYLGRPEVTTVIVATSEIPKGTVITENMISTETVPLASTIPFQRLKKEDVMGKYAASTLIEGELISRPKLADTVPLGADYLIDLPEGQKAVSITMAQLPASVSAKIMPGDIVSVFAVLPTGQPGNSAQDIAADLYPELAYLKVLAVTNAEGFDLSGNPETENLEQPLPSTMTLLANDQQIRLLVGLEGKGMAWAALVYRGDAETAQGYLDRQQAYFDSLAENEENNTDAAEKGA